MADSVGNLQEVMKREALISLQNAVENMDQSTLKMEEQLEHVRSFSAHIDKTKKNSDQITSGSQEILATSRTFAESIKTNRLFLSGMTLIFAFCAGLSSILVRRTVTIPMEKVVTMVKDIAQGEGDLTKRLEIKNTKDELGELSSWFNLFVDRLSRIITDIGQTAEKVMTESRSVSAFSDKITKGAEHVSDKSQTMSAATGRMSASMTSMEVSGEQAASNMGSVSTSASQMNATLDQISRNCDQAKNMSDEAAIKVEEATHRVESLGDAATGISKVIEVITDIAEQTNLLALNATIEAARAGEMGKGFAVVAQEIKNLAGQTAEATSDIKEKVTGIQTSTQGTVSDVLKISELISSVDDVVKAIAESLSQQASAASDVAQSIEQASSNVGEMSGNVSENSHLSAEIAEGVLEMNSVAEEMTEDSRQMNKNAGHLSDLSVTLSKMISVFKVSKTTQKAPQD